VAGRVQSVQALQPYTVHGALSWTSAGVAVRPGQTSDFDVFLRNVSGHPVTVTGVRLVPVPGYPTGRLAHAAVEGGKNQVGAQRGWPPTGMPLHRLVGSQLMPGLVGVAVGFFGTRIGTTYAVAGIELTYRDGGTVRHTVGYGGGTACVAADWRTRGCQAAMDRADTAISSYLHARLDR
jgi:hypothetical protein